MTFFTSMDVNVNQPDKLGLKQSVAEATPAVASAPETEPVDEPAGNATTEEWHAYRLSQGYTEEDLDGLGRDDLKALDDPA